VSGRCCPSVRTVVLPLHTISIIRYERQDHGVWRPDGWTSSARLSLSKIASGREHTSSERLQLSSHICVWDKNPITCRTLNGVRTVLPRHLDGCTWTLDDSRILNSGRTIFHYVQTDATLNSSKLLGTDGGPDRKFSSSERMLLTDERPDGIPHRPDGCKRTELTDLNSAQSLLEAHNWSVDSE
jgi:hypothetical protein